MKSRIVAVLVMACVVMAGCITTVREDGTEETRLDVEALESVYAIAERAFQMYLLYQEAEWAKEQAEAELEIARAEAENEERRAARLEAHLDERRQDHEELIADATEDHEAAQAELQKEIDEAKAKIAAESGDLTVNGNDITL